MEEEQSAVEASNSPTAPIFRAIETEIGSNIRENSDNNIDILGEEAKSNDYKLSKPPILEPDDESDLKYMNFYNQ